MFVGSAKKLAGMAHKILVQRIIQPDQHCQRVAAAAAGSPGLLPQAGDRARIPHRHGRIEVAHIHTQFQGRGGRYAQQLAVKESLLDLAALFGQITGAIRGDTLLEFGVGAVERLA